MWPFKKDDTAKTATKGPARVGSTTPTSRDRGYDPLTDLTSPLNPASPLHPIWDDTDHIGGGCDSGSSNGGGDGGGGGGGWD